MGGYTVERSDLLKASPGRLHGLVNDFHSWPQWSPWEDIDPAMERTYTGAAQGVGAHYAWSGNRKAGAGSMEIVSSTPEEIGIRLDFLKPFKSVGNQLRFSFTPTGDGTRVSWRLTGQHTGLMSLFGRFMNMDKMIGRDFEKGLNRLRAVSERGDQPPG